MDTNESSSLFVRISTAIAFGLASTMTIFVNKILLTNFEFPSFLLTGIGQMLATIVILGFASLIGIIVIPPLDSTIPMKIFPLPIFYFVNLICGLGGTQRISLPMFTMLRRTTILMTMILEYVILGVQASYAVKISVALMIFGAFIAALFDLAFDAQGYAMILINNICTASQGVYIKQKLDAKKLGKYGLLFYNALFMIFPAIIFTWVNKEFEKVYDYIDNGKMDMKVIVCLLLSSVCGLLLNYAIVLCTHHNSALTTNCVGVIKNIFVTYVGMFSSGDYIFSITNFIGINISVLGSILYSYVTFRITKPKCVQKESSITTLPTIINDRKPLL